MISNFRKMTFWILGLLNFSVHMVQIFGRRKKLSGFKICNIHISFIDKGIGVIHKPRGHVGGGDGGGLPNIHITDMGNLIRILIVL